MSSQASRSEVDAAVVKKVKTAVRAQASKPAVKPRFKMTKMTLAPFPFRKRVTMNYCVIFTATPPAVSSAITNTQFRFNSLFDPDVALGGHQPYGFDQWMAMYTRYTVISATAKLTCNPTDAVFYTGNFGMNIVPQNSALVTDEQTTIESQYSVWKPYSQNSSINTCVIKLDVAKYFGVHDVMDDDTLSGTNLTDCGKQALLNCWTSGNLANTPASSFTLVISYDCYVHEPREVGAS